MKNGEALFFGNSFNLSSIQVRIGEEWFCVLKSKDFVFLSNAASNYRAAYNQ
jgi:hypothetical protein